jgi:squalene-associated FAD-dependent desaturase
VPELDRTVMPDPRDVVVIGGGFAGLSAGVALAEAGFRVAVLERKPKLGGRAYSFQDPEGGDWVDNGQHVLMGCYTQTLDFLKKIGTYDQLVFRDRIEMEMVASNGERGRLKAGRLPGPLHMVSALMGYSMLSMGERVSVLMAGARMMALGRFGRKRLENTTVAAMLKRLGQSDHACQCFWFPLAIATLNEEPDKASAALLAEVWKRAFFSRRSDSAFVYSKVGLSDLYCGAAEQFIEQRGGMVASHTGVETLEMDGDHTVGCVRLRDGKKLEAANFIAAVPAGPLLAMLSAPMQEDPFFARLAQLRPSPIICVHVWLDRDVIDCAFVGFIGSTTQWLFNKRAIFAQRGEEQGGYLSFVISGARALVDRSNEELLDLVLDDLHRMIPASREAKLIKALVIKEKQATIAPDCESHQLRPGADTPIDNLFLAGDWIQTGLPATIESAVISGRAAAAAVQKRVGRISPVPVLE